MRGTFFSVLFFIFYFSVQLKASTSVYKIDDREIDLLFERSTQILPSVYFSFQIINNGNPGGVIKTSDDDKKIIAGVLALTFLGAFGVHRYYLGHTKAGVLGYLLPSLCFGIGWIPSIIDGVLYLTSTDDEFNKKYRDNQKIWVWL